MEKERRVVPSTNPNAGVWHSPFFIAADASKDDKDRVKQEREEKKNSEEAEPSSNHVNV
jgi:hypothetical protein